MSPRAPDRTTEPPGAGPDDLGRRRAVVLAGHLGDGRAATAGWHDREPGVRALSLGALRRVDALSDDIVEAALADPSGLVRRRACEELVALGARRPPEATGWLADRLADQDATVVEAACFALGEVLGPLVAGPPPERPAAIEALGHVGTNHADPLCREAAVAALGAIGDPRGLPFILMATRDKAAVRRRAVLALAPFDGPEVEEVLTRALADRDWQVRQAAEDLTAS